MSEMCVQEFLIDGCVNQPIFQKSVIFRGFPAFSARLQALGKQHRFVATRISRPANRGKMVSEGRDFGTLGGARQRSAQAPRRRVPFGYLRIHTDVFWFLLF
jgi:hypothetical protein